MLWCATRFDTRTAFICYIYINDLSMISRVIELILFADDTNLFLHGISLSSLELRLNLELENLSTWFEVNMLSLNPKKTNYMIFTQKTNVTDTLMNIKIDNVPIQQEAQLMLTTGSTRLAVSRGQQTWYHSTCYI